MVAIVRTGAPAALLLLALGACGDAADEGPPPAEYSEVWQSMKDGDFAYEGGRCYFTDPATELRLEFDCGKLLVFLRPGMTADSVADLLDSAGAEVETDAAQGDFPWLLLRVRQGKERDVALQSFRHAAVRYPGLSFHPTPESWVGKPKRVTPGDSAGAPAPAPGAPPAGSPARKAPAGT